MLKTPKFWTKKNFIAFALLPFSLLYFCGFFLIKIFSNPQKISKPVICVGNLIAGGSGKTPTAIAIGKILHEIGINFAFLSRGYMNDGSTFLMIKATDGAKAAVVGDEPLLLTKIAPTFVAKNRLFGARQIEAMKEYQLILLDDAMQNNSLKRDFTILVIDGKIGFGNNFLIPAGPMREPLLSGLRKADLIVLIGDSSKNLLQKLAGKRIVRAKLALSDHKKFLGKKLIAFCGLAYPQKFFSCLQENGLNVIEERSFPDHYRYQVHELENLYQRAEEKNAILITTKKDWVKFPKFFQKKIAFLDVDLEFENKELVRAELESFLKKFYEKSQIFI